MKEDNKEYWQIPDLFIGEMSNDNNPGFPEHQEENPEEELNEVFSSSPDR